MSIKLICRFFVNIFINSLKLTLPKLTTYKESQDCRKKARNMIAATFLPKNAQVRQNPQLLKRAQLPQKS